MGEMRFSLEIHAPARAVWEQISSTTGCRDFFAPNATVRAVSGGEYELYFDPDAPPGEKGSEGMIVMGAEPDSMLSFSWNGPPSIPEIRKQQTFCAFYIHEEHDRCSVEFVNSGYGRGDSWQKAFDYFLSAWGRIVLPRLKYSLEHGAINWDNLPDLPPIEPAVVSRTR